MYVSYLQWVSVRTEEGSVIFMQVRTQRNTYTHLCLSILVNPPFLFPTYWISCHKLDFISFIYIFISSMRVLGECVLLCCTLVSAAYIYTYLMGINNLYNIAFVEPSICMHFFYLLLFCELARGSNGIRQWLDFIKPN